MRWRGFIPLTRNATVSMDHADPPSYADSDVPVLTVMAPTDTNILDARPILQQKAPESTHSQYYLIVFEEDNEKINRAYVNHESSSDPMNMETMFNPILYQYIDGSMSLGDVENMIPEYKVDPSTG